MKESTSLLLQQCADAFVRYRLHVSLLAFFIVLTVYVDAARAVSLESVLVALSFALVAAYAYLINKVTDAAEDRVNVHAGALDERRRLPALIAALACLLLPLLYLVPLGNAGVLGVYTFIAVLGFLYSFPLSFFGATFRLKDVFALKTAFSSLSWALLVAAVFFLFVGSWSPFWTWMVVLIFSVTAPIEIVWDIRDVEGDARHGIRTIPNTLGVAPARTIALILLALAALAGYELSLSTYSILALLASLGFVLAASPKRGKWFYHSIVFVWIAALALFILVT